MIENYPWLKVARVGKVKISEWYLNTDGTLIQCKVSATFAPFVPIVEPDNCYNLIDLADLKIPEGYEIDGGSLAEAFREPLLGGRYLSANGSLGFREWDRVPDARHVCLRKIAPKTKRVLVIEWIDPPIEILKAWTADTADIANRSVRVEERLL